MASGGTAPKARPPGASHNNAEPRRLTLAGGAFSWEGGAAAAGQSV